MNFIQVLGYLVADPEERFTPGGQKVVNLRIADNQKRKGQEETIWWRATLWGEHPLLQYLKKGSAIIVTGEMRSPQIYTNKEGQSQVSNELTINDIRFSPFGRKDSEGSFGGQSAGDATFPSNDSMGGFGSEALSGAGTGQSVPDDVPF